MKSIIKVVFISLIAFSVFSTCDSPMGMGDSIDWIAPVLTVDKVPNPYYVKKNSVLTGTVTDNVAVDRMVFVNSATGIELFPVVRAGSSWTINLNFTSAQNGEKIVGQIIAYDRAGNSGETSIAFITMIVDIKPPILSTLEIKRTESKNKVLMYFDEDKKEIVVPDSYRDLKALEGSDRKDDLYKYQNGWFYITGIINETETRVKTVSLEFYDYNKINTPLLTLPFTIEEGSLDYPKWLIKEEDLLDAGVPVFGADYKTKYYSDSATRYYYRVVIKAKDMSDNENLQDESVCICLWADSDKPKGIADPAIVGTDDKTTLSKGTPIPVDLYDDDSLLWAYTGLLKKDQWTGIPGSTTDAKLLSLKKTLTGNLGENPTDVTLGTQGTQNDWSGTKIMDQIAGKSLDQKLVYLQTGTSSGDYGDYVLFTLVADQKLAPHDNNGPEITNQGRWTGRIVEINLKDENAPLIIFETNANPPCPEENTFPQTLVGGEDFYLVGYTLRENGTGSTQNKVDKFRLAWIPYKQSGWQDTMVTKVQNALKDPNYGSGTALFATDSSLADVRHWDFDAPNTTGGTAGAGKGLLKLVTFSEPISGSTSKYTKQSFSKRFNVMGGKDDIKTSDTAYNNFMVNGILENETKLFIFYAMDSSGNEVFRQLPILGFKNNPKMSILDITFNLDAMPSTKSTPSVATDIPNPTETDNFFPSSGAPTSTYYGLLNTYNKYGNVITALRNASSSPISPGSIKESEPFAIYPRGTTIKYWVKATVNEGNTIPITSLKMEDITFAETLADRVIIGSGFDTTNKTFSFCEYYPDVTQRTFLFTATDQLGNETSVQRTVAVSNAARLESITTTEQTGTYGHGKIITLQANFSSQIYVANEDGTRLTDQTKKPSIVYRYKLKGQSTYIYDSKTCNTPVGGNNTNGFGLWSDTPTISLSFNFEVPLNADCDLETIHEGIAGTGVYSNYDRPILIADGTKIMDKSRNDSAFVPGYVSGNITMPNWKDKANTLQGKKTIKLDGVHPTISGKALFETKAAYSGSGASAEYYFKKDETINLQLTADKSVRAFGSSRLSYTIVPNSGIAQTYNTSFKYQKPVGDTILIYSLKIDSTSCPIDGELTNVSLLQASDSDILDNADNNVDSTTATNLLSGLGRFYIKQKAPDAPSATLSNTEANITDITFNSAPQYYKGAVTLKVPNSTSTYTEKTNNTTISWEDRAQYSTDGGLTWTLAASTPLSPPAINTEGPFRLRARYIDRAGNEGAVAEKNIEINKTFPALISVNAVQANKWYTSGNLTFNLNFADTVYVRTQGNVSITLKNRNTPATGTDAGTDTITLTTNRATGYSGTTITFEWPDVSGKEMRDGLYISNVVLSGLEDKFGIIGPTGTGSYTTNNFNFAACPNLAAGLKVDAIKPTLDATRTDKGRTPQHDVAPTGNALVKAITLTFREPVMKGSGVITIRPRGNYAIPPVLDDTGYYLGYTSNGIATGTGAGTEGPAQPVPTKFSSAGTKYKADGTTADATNGTPNRTYVSSLYDIYNALTSTTDRSALIKSTNNSMSTLQLNDRTGQSAGPYKKMTQGLIYGDGYFGYTGNYSGTDVSSGKNAPDLGGTYGSYKAMIPDTATKWVLDYQYSITGTNAEVTAIRTALTNAKWRWQEIDVVSTSIVNTTTAGTVTITLNEPLLKGLDWDVYYPEGTFTDMAGNIAPGSGVYKATLTNAANNIYTFDENINPGANTSYVPIYVNNAQYTAYVVSSTARTFRIYPAYTSSGGAATGGTTSNLGTNISLWIGLDYYFTSPGVQAPVIRVDRRSYDGRNSNWVSSTNRTYSAPPNDTTGTWKTNAATISDKGLVADGGWGIEDFNYIHYRVETESSAAKGGANVSVQAFKGADINNGGVTAAWSGNVKTATLNKDATLLLGTDPTWTATAATRGTWVFPNLIRRAAGTSTPEADRTYTVITKNGVPETRIARIDSVFRMYKSYNRDLTLDQLNGTGVTLSTSDADFNVGVGQGVLTFSSLEASKSYIVGSATCNSQTAKGYEGVFRTVIVLNYNVDRATNNFFQVQGSNIKNGMPSVAGFPVRDAGETDDNRFTKVFYAAQPADTPAGTNRRTYYWVSTEIVCEWYFIHWGAGNAPNGTHMNVGEVNNYLMVGYGDLTYGFNLTGSGGNLN